MRWKLICAVLPLCARMVWQIPGELEAESSLRYTVELEGLRETAQRLELRSSGWRLLALERGAGLQPDHLAFGLECPWVVAGPLAPRGLLRALADPLGYSPASGVFAEPPGFQLESALQVTARRGLWLEPLPGCLGLFLVRRPSERAENPGVGLLEGGPPGLVQAGGSVTVRWPGPDCAAGRVPSPLAPAPPVRAEAQVVALLSHPEADPGTDPEMDSRVSPPASGAAGSPPADWLLGRAPFPGGGLLHLAGALRLETGGGRLACCLLGAASAGQRVPAGCLGLWRLEAEGRGWSTQALLGACSEEYRLPQGEPYAGAWAAGLRLAVEPRPALRLEVDWRRRIDWPPAVSEGSLPGIQEGGLGARLAVPLRAGGRLEARAAAEARAKYAADGEVASSAGADLGLQLRGPPGSIAAQLRGDSEQGETRLRGELRGERGGVRVQVGAAVRVTASTAGRTASSAVWRPFGRLELAGKGFRFWFAAGSGDSSGSGQEISLGWSAVQALSRSPTVRISRSRR